MTSVHFDRVLVAVIHVGASVPRVPPLLLDQLEPGGYIVVPVSFQCAGLAFAPCEAICVCVCV